MEACDIVAPSGALVHVKRKGKSAVFSHLCFQAQNASQLLRDSADARNQLRALIAARAGAPGAAEGLLERIRDRDPGVEVTFALLGDWRDRSVTSLPLFSKVSLAHTARRIREIGYTPRLKLVGLC